jgi:hypothetical protein
VAVLGCGRSQLYECTLSVSPQALDFGIVGTSATEQVELQSLGNENCTISGLTLTDSSAGFSLPADQPASFFIPPGASAAISVTFQPTSEAPTQRQSSLVFQTSSFTLPAVSIPLSATVPSCLLQISPTAVAFGTATLGTPSSAQVTLTSVGQFTCSVSNVAIAASSDPGFSVPATQPTSFSVLPGAQAAIAVDFELAQSAAPFARQGTLTLTTNDLDSPDVSVPLSAVVPSCTLVVSPSSINFGSVGAGPVTQSVTLTDTGTLACSISAIALASGTDPDFSLAPGQPASLSIAPGGSQSIAVEFNDVSGQTPPLQRTGTLTFDSSDLSQPTLSVPLSATAPSCIVQLVPSSTVYFGTATLGTPLPGQVTVISQGQLACLISNVAIAPGSDPGFFLPASQATSFSVPPGGQAVIDIDFEVAQSAAPYTRQGTLTLATSDLASPQLRVALDAAIPTCDLSVSPPSLDFGSVTVGGSATQSVNLANSGTLACAISSIALASGTDPDFSLSPSQSTSISILPASNQSIPVAFNDLSGDTPPLTRTGTLDFDSNDITQPFISVPLTASIGPCTADSQCPTGQICAFTGPTVGTCGSNIGCADTTREGFLSTTSYPRIAACSGGFAVAGMASPTQCNNTSGNSSSNPNGNGCAAADLCAPNFHICFSSGDVANNSTTGCTGAAPSPNLFFASLQSGPGCELCGGAQGQPACSFPADCNGCQGFGCENDVFGCGDLGDPPDSSCGVLNEFSNNLCSALGAPWNCPNVNAGCSEFATVTKSGPSNGGVLCCGN